MSTDKSYRSAPVREIERTVYITQDTEDKKDEKNKEDEINKENEKIKDYQKKKEICDKVVKGGFLGALGGVALTIGGALITPVCPVVGPALMYGGLTGGGTSLLAEYGGIIANEIIEKDN